MHSRRIGIIGAGRLGSDVAFLLAEDDLCEVVIYDEQVPRAEYLAGDLRDTAIGREYSTQIRWTADMRTLSACDIIVVAAGRPLRADDDPFEVFESNRAVSTEIAEVLVGSSAVFVVGTDPVDLMTSALGIDMQLPPGRVLGLGGLVDSYRARFLIGDALSVNPQYVQAHVAGPHSAEARILWQFCSVNGIAVSDLLSEEQTREIAERFKQNAAPQAPSRPGSGAISRYTSAVACLDVLRTLVKEGRNVLSVSIRCEHILEGTPAAMSAPVVVGQLGGEHIELPGLDEQARSAFAGRARTYAGWLEEGAWR